MTFFFATSAIEAVAFITVVILVGRWAHQTQGLVAGYWFAGWMIYSGLIGMIGPMAISHIIDDFLVPLPPSAWTLGQLQAFASYSGLSLNLLAKIFILILIASELVHWFAKHGSRVDSKVKWLQRFSEYRSHFGVLALASSSLHSVLVLAIWGSLEVGWLTYETAL